MGQYHLIANIDKHEFIHPHRFGDGLKLLEFGCSATGTTTGLTILLAASNGRGGGDLNIDENPGAGEVVGRWAGDRIAIIGDYFEEGDVPGLSKAEMEALWGDDEGAHAGWNDISKSVIAAMASDSYIRDDLRKRRDWASSGTANVLGEPWPADQAGGW